MQACSSVARAPKQAQPSSFAEFLSRRQFSALDGIRALSILAVLWHHTAAGVGSLRISSNGFLGVDMFFVLSGFLIVTLLLRERERSGGISLKRFYARRTLRIFPIYYLVLAALLVYVTILRPGSGMRADFLRELPYHVTYTTNWIQSTTFLAIAWSLAAEEQFYLVWPPLEKYFARYALVVLALLLALNEAVNFGLLDGFLREIGLPREEYNILQCTFAPICLGVLLAHTLHRPQGFRRMRAVFESRWSLWLVLAALLVAASLSELAGLPRLTIHLLMTLFLAGCVLDEGHVIARLLSRPLMRWLGAISYGMYIYHHFARHAALYFLHRIGVESVFALFVSSCLLTIAVAAASHRLIEEPLASWKRRLRPA